MIAQSPTKQKLEGKDIGEAFKNYGKGTHEYAMQEAFQNMAEKQKDEQKKNDVSTIGQTSVMAASSLQQIGGGDVSSVMGVYSVADNIRITAENTTKMAEKDQSLPTAKTITSVAK
jgi:hypothetical protein